MLNDIILNVVLRSVAAPMVHSKRYEVDTDQSCFDHFWAFYAVVCRYNCVNSFFWGLTFQIKVRPLCCWAIRVLHRHTDTFRVERHTRLFLKLNVKSNFVFTDGGQNRLEYFALKKLRPTWVEHLTEPNSNCSRTNRLAWKHVNNKHASLFPPQSVNKKKVLNNTTLLTEHAQYFSNHVSVLQNFFLCHWGKA
jgi:hypothetical protein